MQNDFEHEYPPAEWTETGLATAFEGGEPAALPRREDRDRWETIRGDDVVAPLAAEIIERADTVSGEPPPANPASLWVAYGVEGDDAARQEWLDRFRTRLFRLREFVMAECLEGEGRFLDDVLDHAWTLCERTSWVNPGNLNQRGRVVTKVGGLPRASPPPEERSIDLNARIGFHLAETDYLLGDALHPGFRERIREECERKLLAPYESRDDFWWWTPPTNSWNAACHSACLGTALYLEEDPERLARLTKRAVESQKHFLSVFGSDGGSVEGPGYWNGGFFRFVRLAELLEARTDGEYSFFDVPVVGELAQYPLRIELTPGRYPGFGDGARPTVDDGSNDVYLRPCHACRLGTEYDLPGLIVEGKRALEARPFEELRSIRNLVWCAGVPEVERPLPEKRNFLSDIQWWIARADPTDPDAPVVAARGGTNAESHTHADAGTFIYHLDGTAPIDDLGVATYPANYHGEGRYSYLMARSLGHSVPYVAGHEQRSEPRRQREEVVMPDPPAAEVLRVDSDESRDCFALELSDCYPSETNLAGLERHFEFERPTGALTVTDTARFRETDADRWFESVLVSYQPMERTADGLVVGRNNTRVHVDVGGDVTPEKVWIEHLQDAVPENYSTTRLEGYDVWRARIGPATGETVTVELGIKPQLSSD